MEEGKAEAQRKALWSLVSSRGEECSGVGYLNVPVHVSTFQMRMQEGAPQKPTVQ